MTDDFTGKVLPEQESHGAGWETATVGQDLPPCESMGTSPLYHTPVGPVYAQTPQGSRLAGRIQREMTDMLIFSKHVSERKHHYRVLDAWGFDAGVVEQLARVGVQRIVVLVDDIGQKEECTFDTLLQHGIRLDLGHGEQIVLPRHFFTASPLQSVLFDGEEVSLPWTF